MRNVEERVTELEIALAHQQRFCDQMNEVLIEQGREIDAQAAQLKLLKSQLEGMREQPRPNSFDPAADKPPHY